MFVFYRVRTARASRVRLTVCGECSRIGPLARASVEADLKRGRGSVYNRSSVVKTVLGARRRGDRAIHLPAQVSCHKLRHVVTNEQ